MDRFIARRNIEHFRHLLDQELDPHERERVESLLREAQDELRKAEEAYRRNPPQSTG